MNSASSRGMDATPMVCRQQISFSYAALQGSPQNQELMHCSRGGNTQGRWATCPLCCRENLLCFKAPGTAPHLRLHLRALSR